MDLRKGQPKSKPRKVYDLNAKWDIASYEQQFVTMHAAYYKYKTDEELFGMAAYLGYLYIPISADFGEWWDDTNESGYLRAKVIEVTPTSMTILHIDNHNGGLSRRTIIFNDVTDRYCIVGNRLTVRDDT